MFINPHRKIYTVYWLIIYNDVTFDDGEYVYDKIMMVCPPVLHQSIVNTPNICNKS